jgi:hypothetical protein
MKVVDLIPSFLSVLDVVDDKAEKAHESTVAAIELIMGQICLCTTVHGKPFGFGRCVS